MKNSTNGEKVFKTPCISLIIPTHKLSADRKLDPLEIKKIIKRASESLEEKFGNNGSLDTIRNLETLVEKIDYAHNENGLGLFVSDKSAEIVKFPFEVKEKLIIDNNFAIRDRLYLNQVLTDYFVLDLTVNFIGLYKGNGHIVQEIKNHDFPAGFVDDYEYEKAALGSSNGYSLKSTEQDQSVIKEIRFVSFIKRVDKLLSQYINTAPLIVTGVKRDLGYFMKHSSHAEQVAGEVIGNHNDHLSKLGELAFEEMKKYFVKKRKEALEKLDQNIGMHKAVIGTVDCWRAAGEGKGLLLMVEKDFYQTGFISRKDVYHFYPTLPDEDFEIVEDAGEAIIKKVLEKNGKILFFENQELSKFQGIALIERYA